MRQVVLLRKAIRFTRGCFVFDQYFVQSVRFSFVMQKLYYKRNIDFMVFQFAGYCARFLLEFAGTSQTSKRLRKMAAHTASSSMKPFQCVQKTTQDFHK